MDYYRRINKVVNDVKLKIQLGALTLKLSENNKKIDDLIGVDKNIKKDIISISNLINSNTESISTNLEKIDNFTQYILQSGKDFEEKYIIEKQIFKFDKDKHFYTMFEKEIEFDFTKNSLLFVKNNIYYKYDDLLDDYHRLQHEYNIYDGDNLIHKYLFNKDTYYDENLDPILHTNEDFCICFKKNYKKIKINLQLHRHNRHGKGNINLEIDDDNEKYINIDYVDRNNDEQIDTNTRNISTNLSKININVADISSNLKEISTNKGNISSNLGKINDIQDSLNNIKLKNIYNIKYFDYKQEIKFNESFFNKTFNVIFKKNDYIEIDLKMKLEYEDIDDSKIIKTEIELYNNMNEIILGSNYINKDYISYSNFVFFK